MQHPNHTHKMDHTYKIEPEGERHPGKNGSYVGSDCVTIRTVKSAAISCFPPKIT